MRDERDRKAVLHLICGLPGSGKTTLAKKIEASRGAVRFCPDEWIKEIWPPGTAETEGNARRDQVEQLQFYRRQMQFPQEDELNSYDELG